MCACVHVYMCVYMCVCMCVDINSFNYKNKKNILSLFHLKIASLKKNKDELETFLNMIKFKFDFMGITETKGNI